MNSIKSINTLSSSPSYFNFSEYTFTEVPIVITQTLNNYLFFENKNDNSVNYALWVRIKREN
jgi:hypothetical protein